MILHDVRIPGLTMTVVQGNCQNEQPVAVEEFRVGPAAPYDVIVQSGEDHVCTVFADTTDRAVMRGGMM